MKRKLVLMTSALMAISLLAGCGHEHVHNWGKVVYEWSTDYTSCTATRVCKGDENHKEEETVKSVYSVITSATCEVDGKGKYTATFTNTAFEVQVKEETIEAKGHLWGTPTYVWSDDYSSCTATRVCKNDPNHKESETADSAYTEIIPATCDTDGSAVYDVAFENEAFEVQSHEVTLPATGHNWGIPTYTWSNDYSSCTATRVCENDPTHVETETADSAYTEIIPATCDTNGSAVYDVAFENEAFEVQSHEVTLPAIGHEWGTITYTWSDDYSSCTASRVCAHDATHVDTETVNSTYKVVEEAKCEEDGKGKYTATFKNTAFEAQTHEITLPATGHNWGIPTYTWSNDYSSCTATRVCGNNPNHKESETVDSTSIETQASYFVEGSITYTATFTSAAFSTQTYKQKTSDKIPYYGEVPLLSEDGKTLTYGLYPQTNVNDEELLTALNALTTPETNGYYFYENAYYTKLSATPLPYLDFTFDNGTVIENGTNYWFKCEPITWNVLSNNNGEYYILSSVLLDTHCYYSDTNNRVIGGKIIYSNNYEHSDIRSWLNDEFYNSAFALSNSHIQTTTVYNSASTTSPSENPYVCNDTEDKVFLPSYQDYINSNYGFLDSEDYTKTRECKTTDWARARGAYCDCDTDSSYQYNGFYWTRSPYSSGSSPTNDDDVRAWYVDIDGQLNCSDAYYEFNGVRPAISIKIA